MAIDTLTPVDNVDQNFLICLVKQACYLDYKFITVFADFNLPNPVFFLKVNFHPFWGPIKIFFFFLINPDYFTLNLFF